MYEKKKDQFIPNSPVSTSSSFFKFSACNSVNTKRGLGRKSSISSQHEYPNCSTARSTLESELGSTSELRPILPSASKYFYKSNKYENSVYPLGCAEQSLYKRNLRASFWFQFLAPVPKTPMSSVMNFYLWAYNFI